MDNIEKSLLKFGEELVKDMQKLLETKGKNATGELSDSLKAWTEEEDGMYFLYYEAADYAEYVDGMGYAYSRRPNSDKKTFPPITEIRNWMSVKGIRGSNAKETENYAWNIRRKIGIRGIKATPFLYLFKDTANKLNDLIEKTAAEQMQETLDNFKDINKKNNR